MNDHQKNINSQSSGAESAALPVHPAIAYGWLRALMFFIAFLVATVAQSIVAVVVIGATTNEQFVRLLDKPVMLWIEIMQMAVALFLTWVFRRFIDRRSLVSLGFAAPRWAKIDLVAGLLGGLGLVTAIFLIQWMLGWVRVVGVSFPFGSLAIMAGVIALAASREEIIMRGYMLHNIMQSANKYLSLLMIAAVFALSHGLNPNITFIGLANIVIAGLLLGVYYIHCGNLWFPIGLHIGWNYFQGAVWGSPVSGITLPSIIQLEFVGPELWTGGSFGFEASLLATIVTSIATVMIHFRYRNRRRDVNSAEQSSGYGTEISHT